MIGIEYWFALCKEVYPGEFEVIQSLKDDTVYTDDELRRACAESAFILDMDEMPEWATIVESFEMAEDGSYIFIYRYKL